MRGVDSRSERGYLRPDRFAMPLEIRLLGSVEALVDGHSLALGGSKQRGVVAMLALNANRTLSGDELADGLWGDDLPASAAKNLHVYVSRLRKALAESRAEAEILTRGRGYELRLSAGAVDALRFAAAGRGGRPRAGRRRGERRWPAPRSSCGAARRSPTSPTSRSPAPRSAGSRSFTCGPSSSRSTPSSPPGATPRRSPGSRR